MQIDELRLGPLQSQQDLAIAADALARKENEVIRNLLALSVQRISYDQIDGTPTILGESEIEALVIEKLKGIVVEGAPGPQGPQGPQGPPGQPSYDAGFLNGQPGSYYTGYTDDSISALDLDSIVGLLNAAKLYGDAFITSVTADYINAAIELTVDNLSIGQPINWSGGGGQAPIVGLPSSSLVAANFNADKIDGYDSSGLGRLDSPGTWIDSQVFNAAASFQSPTVPFVVVGSDRVDNLNSQYWDGLGRGTTGQVVLGATSAAPLYGQIEDAHVHGAAAIAWSKINKTGASLADITAGVLPKAQQHASTAYIDAANSFNQDQTISRTGANAMLYLTRSTGVTMYLQAQAATGVINCQTAAGGAAVLRFSIGGSGKWEINTGGHFVASTDAATDIGAAGANRPRDIYLSRDLTVGREVILGNPTVATTASAGAQTLPANPVGFLVVNIAGTNRKIPYYAT